MTLRIVGNRRDQSRLENEKGLPRRRALAVSGGRNLSPAAFKINRWTPSHARGYSLPALRDWVPWIFACPTRIPPRLKRVGMSIIPMP